MLADAILLLHAVIVFFNIGALPLIWVGHVLKWKAVRNFYFRVVHLLLIAFIAAESVFDVSPRRLAYHVPGRSCALTGIEGHLQIHR